MSEFVEAAKRLNVASASQIQTMVVNADPTKVEATLGEKIMPLKYRSDSRKILAFVAYLPKL